MKFKMLLIIVFYSLFSCIDNSDAMEPSIYFPPTDSEVWETLSMADAGFNPDNLTDLLSYLDENGTKGFIVLKKGRIVIEAYFNGHSQDANWYWASAGKTLTSLTVGIAQQENYLSIEDKTSDYLGNAWTSETLAQENNITIKHQLSMTTGLNDLIFSCTEPSCLYYKADAGSRWAYHNAPYTLLQDVISQAVPTNFNNYFEDKIKNRIGMNGTWFSSGYNKVYWSTTRSMARFGLLILNKGKWNGTPVLNDPTYYQEMIQPSQNINPSYGYLWWLNGKSSYMLPQSQVSFQSELITTAPADLIAALGKNDQKLYVVPSQSLVIVRMGESAANSELSVSGFDSILWQKIHAVINN